MYSPAVQCKLKSSQINKLPTAVRHYVQAWMKDKNSRRVFYREVALVNIEEDVRYTAFNLESGLAATGRAGGEWNGQGDFTPGKELSLPRGVAMVAHGIYGGAWYLTVYWNPNSMRPQYTTFLGNAQGPSNQTLSLI